jgi:hypothetical protein
MSVASEKVDGRSGSSSAWAAMDRFNVTRDPREIICGIRPAVLKNLLHKGYERFDSPTAMEFLGPGI